MRRSRGAEEQRCGGAEEQRSRGAEEPRRRWHPDASYLGPSHPVRPCSSAPRHLGTSAPRLLGSSAPRLLGSSAPQRFALCTLRLVPLRSAAVVDIFNPIEGENP